MLDFLLGLFDVIIQGILFVFDPEYRKNVFIFLSVFSGCALLFVAIYFAAKSFVE